MAALTVGIIAFSCATASGGGAAKQSGPADKPFALPLTEFKPWYKAKFQGDTIALEGGGVDYLLPLDVDLNAYSQLVLVYETFDWVDEDAVLKQTGKANTMQLSVKDWDGGDSRIDLTYPYIVEGAGEAVLLEGEQYDALKQKGVEGFSLAANVWSNNGISTYKVKVISLELRP
jgi:hypothetical protein